MRAARHHQPDLRHGPHDGRLAPARDLATSIAFRATAIDAEVRVTGRPGDAHRFATRGASSAGVDLVVAWGGDGTVNEVASALAGTGDAAWRSCPADRATAWRAISAIPFDPAAALEIAATGRERRDRCRRSGRVAVLQHRRHRPRRAHRRSPGGAGRAPRLARLRASRRSASCAPTSPGTIRSQRFDVDGSALADIATRGAVHRARQLAPVRQRRADRAARAAGRRHDRDRRRRAAVGAAHHAGRCRRSFAARCARAPAC